MSELALLMIFSHLIADFPFQFNYINAKKNRYELDEENLRGRERTLKEQVHGILLHILIHFAVTLIIVFLYSIYIESLSMWKISCVIIISTFIHGVIDFIKEYFFPSIPKKNITESLQNRHRRIQIGAYLVDQFLHFTTIILLLWSWDFIDVTVNGVEKIFQFLIDGSQLNLSLLDRLVSIGIVIVFTTSFSGYLIEKLVRKIENNLEDTKKTISLHYDVTNVSSSGSNSRGKLIEDLRDTGLPIKSNGMQVEETITEIEYMAEKMKYGKYIGYLERLLIMVLVAMNSIGVIAFVVAIKALARFKQFEDRNFAEYYLLGTMVSILLGIISGGLIFRLIN